MTGLKESFLILGRAKGEIVFHRGAHSIIAHTFFQIWPEGRCSVEQDDSGSQLDSGEKISGEFVVACGDGSKMPEFIEEALGEVAFAVEREIAKPLGFAVRFRRDDRSDFPAGSGWR